MARFIDVRNDLTDIIVAVVDCDPADVVDDAQLQDLGVDSLARVEVCDELGRRYRSYIDDETANSVVTVGDLVTAVQAAKGGPKKVTTTLHHPPVKDEPVKTSTDDSDKRNAISKIAGLFIAIGAVLGAILGLGGAAFVAATGIGGVDLPPISAPAPEPSKSPSPSPKPTDSADDDTKKQEKKSSEPSFKVGSKQVAPSQRFSISGRYPKLDAGEVLEVQMLEESGEWRPFPVTTITLEGGRYKTEIYTARVGDQKFRMLHRASNTATKPQTVRVG